MLNNKLILIGNKDIKKDISKDLEQFDTVVRINRCTNWENTKTLKTDYWLMDIAKESLFADFIRMPQACIDTLISANKIFFFENTKNVSLWTLLNFNGLNKLIIEEYRYTFDIEKYFPKFDFLTYRPTNFMWMLLYIIERLSKINNYEIYITATDIYDRSYLKYSNFHKECYKQEEQVLQDLLNKKIINLLPYE